MAYKALSGVIDQFLACIVANKLLKDQSLNRRDLTYVHFH